MIVLRPADDGQTAVTLWLRPNRALSRRGMRYLIGWLVLLVAMTAGLGAWQGNVFAPLFALVESAAMIWALGLAWRSGNRSERITLDDASLEVRSLPGRHRASFQSYWVRVRLAPGHDRHRLLLRSHGRELEIGSFLAEEERAAVAGKLKLLLADRQGPPRG